MHRMHLTADFDTAGQAEAALAAIDKAVAEHGGSLEYSEIEDLDPGPQEQS